jgi:hypothetical protein
MVHLTRKRVKNRGAPRPATGSSDPLTSLRFGGRSQKRKRQKLPSESITLVDSTLAGRIPLS